MWTILKQEGRETAVGRIRHKQDNQGMIDHGFDLSRFLRQKSANLFQLVPSRLAADGLLRFLKSKKVLANGRSPFLQNEERCGGKNGTYLIRTVSYDN